MTVQASAVRRRPEARSGAGARGARDRRADRPRGAGRDAAARRRPPPAGRGARTGAAAEPRAPRPARRPGAGVRPARRAPDRRRADAASARPRPHGVPARPGRPDECDQARTGVEGRRRRPLRGRHRRGVGDRRRAGRGRRRAAAGTASSACASASRSTAASSRRDRGRRAVTRSGRGSPCKAEAMDERPSGTVTFLFTDIEGSTVLLRQVRDALRRAARDAQPAPPPSLRGSGRSGDRHPGRLVLRRVQQPEGRRPRGGRGPALAR